MDLLRSTTISKASLTRAVRTRKHPLINLLFIAVCGALSGANSFAAVHEFGCDRRTWLARFLDRANGTPCEDTLRRVLARLDSGPSRSASCPPHVSVSSLM